jgi:predicted PurR-regulated permease PerM
MVVSMKKARATRVLGAAQHTQHSQTQQQAWKNAGSSFDHFFASHTSTYFTGFSFALVSHMVNILLFLVLRIFGVLRGDHVGE